MKLGKVKKEREVKEKKKSKTQKNYDKTQIIVKVIAFFLAIIMMFSVAVSLIFALLG